MVSRILQTFIHKWPGERVFGVYRFMPLFFIIGASLEFAMIHWRPFGVNFYDTYKKKEARRLAEEAIKMENSLKSTESLPSC